MREILFRGKRVDNGEWVHGSFTPDLLEVYQIDKTIFGYIKPHGKTREERLMTDVLRETVGQYTGLTDKNGVKIFEGDIVYAETPNTKGRYQVKFEFGQFCIGINMPVAYVRDSCEVVGNIHDNPDLLTCRDNG